MHNQPLSWTSLFAKLCVNTKKRRKVSNSNQNRKLRFEQCEDRRLLAITVNNPGDFIDANPNVTTFREAIDAANINPDPDEIAFASSLRGQTINITGSNLIVTERVTITGPSTGFV